MKFYGKVVKTLIVMSCFSIVLLNIFKLSFASYAAENSEFVKYNIFDFYKAKESFKLLSTRGWFDSANEVSAILATLLPINIYLLFKEKKRWNYILCGVQMIAMIIVGTRISAYCAILIGLLFIGINIFSKFYRNEKINYRFIILIIVCSGYFFLSPFGNYQLKDEKVYFDSDDEYSEELEVLENEDSIEYIKNNLQTFRINEHFIDLYPLEEDIDFWRERALGDRNENNNSRVMKLKIIERIKERNNNKYDSLFGMGYTLNFEDLERDYVYQYYIFGIVGLVVLLLPQVIMLIKNSLIVLKNYKRIEITKTLLLLSSPFICLACAYLSGHVLGWVSPSYILILVISLVDCMNKEV